MSIGSNIRQLRDTRNLTQEKLKTVIRHPIKRVDK